MTNLVVVLVKSPLKPIGEVRATISLRDDASGVASAISEGDIFIYSCSAQLISFEVDTISKEINCAEHEYISVSPSSYYRVATPLDDAWHGCQYSCTIKPNHHYCCQRNNENKKQIQSKTKTFKSFGYIMVLST